MTTLSLKMSSKAIKNTRRPMLYEYKKSIQGPYKRLCIHSKSPQIEPKINSLSI